MKVKHIDGTEEAKAYILERGYASYSSLKNYRDGEAPRKYENNEAFAFGEELHVRFLENRKQSILSPPLENQMFYMINELKNDRMAMALMDRVFVEAGFNHPLHGFNVKGYIDIFKPGEYCADLKTTSLTKLADFKDSMDLLQAAVYLEITGCKEFYYLGISKKAPYTVMTFRVTQKEVKEQKKVLKELLTSLTK